MKDNRSIFCYLSHSGKIHDKTVDVFVDSGASFNAITPSAARKLGLLIEEKSKLLTLTLGAKQKVQISRRVTQFSLQLEGFPSYSFVMEVPEQKDICLGYKK